MKGIKPKLKDQVAIITSANSGIGAGVAHSLASEGAIVVINYPVSESKKKALR